jgi:predicted transcriptional regulator
MPISETPLDRIRVSDAMHTGILTTGVDTPLSLVAHLMAERRVHAVAVADRDYDRRPLSFVSVLDVAAAVAAGETDLVAAQAARTELRPVGSDEGIERAAQLMAQHQVEHLVVIDPSSGHAEGIVSALDVAAAFGR